MARDHAHLKVNVGVARGELRELNEARWREALAVALSENGKSRADLETEPTRAPWKIAIATRPRSNRGCRIHGHVTSRSATGRK